MSDAGSKQLPPLSGASPERGDFGKPGKEQRDPRFAELDAMIAKQESAKRTAQTAAPKATKPQRKRKRRSPPLPQQYRQDITRMARQHRKRFGKLLLADPKLKDRSARFYRSLLLPKPKRRGRPPVESVTIATRLLQKYRREYPDETPEQWWKRIYPQAIPGYEKLGREERKAQQLLLRERVRSRRNQQRRRQNHQQALSPHT